MFSFPFCTGHKLSLTQKLRQAYKTILCVDYIHSHICRLINLFGLFVYVQLGVCVCVNQYDMQCVTDVCV